MDLIRRVSFSKDRYHQQVEMINWCEQHCGEGGWSAFSRNENARWSVDGMFGHTHFFFKEEKDLVLFTMRWF